MESIDAVEPRRDVAHNARHTVAASLATSLAIQGLNVATGVALARWLGPHDRGAMAAVLLWPTILIAVGSLGMIDASAFLAARREFRSGTLVGTVLGVGLLQSLVLMSVGAVIVSFALAQYDEGTVKTAYLLLAYIPFNLLAHYLMWILSGLHKFLAFQALRLATIAAAAVGILALAGADHLTVRNAALVHILTNAMIAAAAAILVAREMDGRLQIEAAVAKRVLRYGLRSHVSNFSTALNERLDQIAISLFLAPVQLGLYVVAVTVASAVTMVGASFAIVALPIVARIDAPLARARVARRLIGLTFAASAAAALPLLLLADRLLHVFFGSDFAGAANVTRVLLLAAVILSTNRVLAAVLKGVDRPLDAGIAELLALAATAVSLGILLPSLGIVGAGAASVIAYGLSMGWMVRRVSTALEISPAQVILSGWTHLRMRSGATHSATSSK